MTTVDNDINYLLMSLKISLDIKITCRLCLKVSELLQDLTKILESSNLLLKHNFIQGKTRQKRGYALLTRLLQTVTTKTKSESENLPKN